MFEQIEGMEVGDWFGDVGEFLEMQGIGADLGEELEGDEDLEGDDDLEGFEVGYDEIEGDEDLEGFEVEGEDDGSLEGGIAYSEQIGRVPGLDMDPLEVGAWGDTLSTIVQTGTNLYQQGASAYQQYRDMKKGRRALTIPTESAPARKRKARKKVAGSGLAGASNSMFGGDMGKLLLVGAAVIGTVLLVRR